MAVIPPLDPQLVNWPVSDFQDVNEVADPASRPRNARILAEDADKWQAAARAMFDQVELLRQKYEQLVVAAGVQAEPAGKGALIVSSGSVPRWMAGGTSSQVLAGDPTGPYGARWVRMAGGFPTDGTDYVVAQGVANAAWTYGGDLRLVKNELGDVYAVPGANQLLLHSPTNSASASVAVYSTYVIGHVPSGARPSTTRPIENRLTASQTAPQTLPVLWSGRRAPQDAIEVDTYTPMPPGSSLQVDASGAIRLVTDAFPAVSVGISFDPRYALYRI